MKAIGTGIDGALALALVLWPGTEPWADHGLKQRTVSCTVGSLASKAASPLAASVRKRRATSLVMTSGKTSVLLST